MVDQDRLTRLLDRVRADVDHLAGAAPRSSGRLDDVLVVSGIKYLFVTAIEGCAKVAHHISASEGWPAAETNSDAVRQLAHHGVVPRVLAASIADAVSFRNLLVHQYADVDDERVVAHLDELDDLRDFVAAVYRWLESQDGSGGYSPTER